MPHKSITKLLTEAQQILSEIEDIDTEFVSQYDLNNAVNLLREILDEATIERDEAGNDNE